jgi:hypothetical protein
MLTEGKVDLDELKEMINIVSKRKGKVVQCLTKHQAMMAYWGSGCIAPLIP